VETCAAAIVAPSRSGFGSKVIEASIKGQLGGLIERSWLPTGLKCSFTVPGEYFSAPARSIPPPREADGVGEEAKPRHLRGLRVLILEDEPLIAMMTSRIVRELEAEVVGPFASITEASQALATPVDAALLDVNVGGQLVYGFADEIRNAGAPIIFVTGYQSGAIDPRFADETVLTKPVDSDDLAAALAGASLRRVV
jgi:CheY-like chemotaxis protein